MKKIETIRRALPDSLKGNILDCFFFRKEAALFRGDEGCGKSCNGSIIFYTMHKCASTFMPILFSSINKRVLHYKVVDLEGYVYNRYGGQPHQILSGRPDIFASKGFLFCPHRRVLNFSKGVALRPIVMVRDPRDILTSLYFSVTKSHRVPLNKHRRKLFLERRHAAQQLSIDDYVISRVDEFNQRMDELRHVCIEHQIAPILYEDFVVNFDLFYASICSQLGVDTCADELHRLRKLSGFNQEYEAENSSLHIRQRIPGDHAKKLSRETIQYLDEAFKQNIDFFQFVSST